MKGREVEESSYKILKELGFSQQNTLYADSSCPDEINHNGADITTNFQKRWGKVFPLAGLGGLPFAG